MKKVNIYYIRYVSDMNRYLLVCIFILLPAMLFLTTNCKKDDEQERKEALIRNMLDDINADSLEADVIWLQNMGTRFALAQDHRNVAVRIKKRFISMGYDEAHLDSFFITRVYRNIEYKQMQYNVIAVIQGSVFADSLCIMGGHYDNILGTGDPFAVVPGANDNASGTAAVMEVARVMKKYGFTPERSVMFIAFGSEELGLYGSTDFAGDPGEYANKISFMLNNDMIAYETGPDPALWRVNIMDYDNSHKLRNDAESVIKKYSGLIYKNDNTNNKYSDSYPFFTHGYKALFFFSDKTDLNYHTPNDLGINCNFEYCREIVRVNCALLADKN